MNNPHNYQGYSVVHRSNYPPKPVDYRQNPKEDKSPIWHSYCAHEIPEIPSRIVRFQETETVWGSLILSFEPLYVLWLQS